MPAKFTLFAMAVMLASPVAANSSQDTPPQVAVSYADLDLATASGLQALNSRIRAAIRSVCGVAPGLASHVLSRRCVAEASIRTDKQLAELLSSDRVLLDARKQIAVR